MKKRWVFLLAALAVLGALGVLLPRALGPLFDRPDMPPAEQIPDSWHEVRKGEGHVRHLSQKDVSCRDCHGDLQAGFARVSVDVCSKCHEDTPAVLHQSDVARSKTDCFSCHTFRPSADIEPANCRRCHSEQDAATPALAVAVHAKEKCTSCHAPHSEPTLSPANCLTCHEEQRTEHAEAGAAVQIEACLDCHKAHQPAATARERCSSCHQSKDKKPIVPASATFAGHDTCTTCHATHDFSRAAAKACNTCHNDQLTLGANHAPAHAACKSCHQPHAVRAASEATCSGCHRAVQSEHPKVNGKRCLSCHQIHPPPTQVVAAKAQSCTSCHREASSSTAFHAGGISCQRCHQPHQPDLASAGKALCAGCHQATVNAVASGHADCNRCHQDAAHRPSAPTAACSTCHAPQAKTAPAGHQQCASCHQPHPGKLKPGTSCASCHSQKQTGIHKNVSGGCTSCHRPHGPGGVPKPPACTQCHTAAKLGGLHQLANHQRACTTCHSAHQTAPTGARADCLGCHKAQTDHQPGSPRCTTCHFFE